MVACTCSGTTQTGCTEIIVIHSVKSPHAIARQTRHKRMWPVGIYLKVAFSPQIIWVFKLDSMLGRLLAVLPEVEHVNGALHVNRLA